MKWTPGCNDCCSTISVTCCTDPVPKNLHLNLVFSSGSQCGCLGASLSVPMTWNSGASQWDINYSCGGGVSLTGRMYCSGGTFRLEVALGDLVPHVCAFKEFGSNILVEASGTCSPFNKGFGIATLFDTGGSPGCDVPGACAGTSVNYSLSVTA